MARQGCIDNAPRTPLVIGFQCAGDVEAVGDNVTDFNIGDRVIALTDYHAWAEVVSVPAQTVYHMPTGMNYHEGAAFPLNWLSAYILLFDQGGLRPGQSVLVHSVGGGVGQAIAQLCKTVDDVTLYGTASHNKHEQIKNDVTYLYDHVVDYAQEIRKASPDGVDLVLDSLCGEDANKGIGLLKPMGRYVLYGSSNIVTGETKSIFSVAKAWWQIDKISPIKLYDENKSISGFNLRQLLFHQGKHAYVRDVMNILFKMYNQGKIKPVIDSVVAFEDIGEAMQKMHDRKNVGSIVLDPTMTSSKNAAPETVNQNEAEHKADDTNAETK
ncbi:synaptic vesicle membrane protein VAT-1 homolog-like isoform X2 [Lingula anatina]|nr:synaptic vesicle membrane protein VAT-1 homolog-like isoform X2 [Lingula anatina]|eukprot:XP_013397607.1 synaptic vesicle membrane protein VAT-1 homolog-like isoform X2 [Lingula anatina]